MADRDPITCHVLNTYTGTPAAGIPVTLTLSNVQQPSPVNSSCTPADPPSFTARTDGDGRVKNWQPSPSSRSKYPSLAAAFATFPSQIGSDGGSTRSTWTLRFANVGKWYAEQGVDCFWGDVSVQFVVSGKEGETGWRHYHVPVLLGPWSYSTYRGS